MFDLLASWKVLAIAVVLLFITASVWEYYYTPISVETVANNYWAGYVATTSIPGSVSNVSASWTVPMVNCTQTRSASVLVWVGIDGWNENYNTVEQIGTRADCSGESPSYVAWYEFWRYQPNTITISNVTLHPSDKILAWVSGLYYTKTFVMRLEDQTDGQASLIHGNYTLAQLATAEWVVEAPGPVVGEKQSLANFTPAIFKDIRATIGGRSSSPTSFVDDKSVNLMALIYTCSDGFSKATPSQLEQLSDSFTVTWSAGGSC